LLRKKKGRKKARVGDGEIGGNFRKYPGRPARTKLSGAKKDGFFSIYTGSCQPHAGVDLCGAAREKKETTFFWGE